MTSTNDTGDARSAGKTPVSANELSRAAAHALDILTWPMGGEEAQARQLILLLERFLRACASKDEGHDADAVTARLIKMFDLTGRTEEVMRVFALDLLPDRSLTFVVVRDGNALAIKVSKLDLTAHRIWGRLYTAQTGAMNLLLHEDCPEAGARQRDRLLAIVDVARRGDGLVPLTDADTELMPFIERLTVAEDADTYPEWGTPAWKIAALLLLAEVYVFYRSAEGKYVGIKVINQDAVAA